MALQINHKNIKWELFYEQLQDESIHQLSSLNITKLEPSTTATVTVLNIDSVSVFLSVAR